MHVFLYTTPYCHLCEEAEMILNHIDQITSIQKIDIAQSEEMVEEYGVRIPVLRVQSGEELEWPFDQGQVLNFIKSE
jgi:hypothetical protein